MPIMMAPGRVGTTTTNNNKPSLQSSLQATTLAKDSPEADAEDMSIMWWDMKLDRPNQFNEMCESSVSLLRCGWTSGRVS